MVKLVVEGAKIGSVTSYWASSDARSAGRAGVWLEWEWRTLDGTDVVVRDLRRARSRVSFEPAA